MSTGIQTQRDRAMAAAAAWWQGRPFPYMPQDGPYPCTSCGRPILEREGTSLVGAQMRCPECTARHFDALEAAEASEAAHAVQPATPVPAPRPPAPVEERAAPTTVFAGNIAAFGPPAPPPSTVVPPTVAPSVPPPRAEVPPPPVHPLGLPPTVPPPAGQAPPGRGRGLPMVWVIVIAVVAVAGLVVGGLLFWAPWKSSGPSTAAVAPAAPGAVHVVGTTPDSVTLGWSAPTGQQTPSSYDVVVSGTHEVMGSVPGSSTSYQLTGLAPATEYAVQVVAHWGQTRSQYSDEVIVTTATPAVADARLTGTMTVDLSVTASTGGLDTGQAWSDTWTFTASCASGPCNATLDGGVTPPGYESHSFQVPLTRNGATYSGSAPAHLTHCGATGSEVDVNDTVKVDLTVTSGAVTEGAWAVNAWNGTLQVDSPYTLAGQYYCPAQSFTMSLSSAG